MTAGGSRAADAAPYTVIVMPTAERALKAVHSKADRRELDAVLSLLDTFPRIGRLYDPVYAAARPRRDVLVFYAGHYGVYYVIDEAARAVNVLFIEDQCRNPLKRFSE